MFLHIQSSQHGRLTYTRHNTCPSPQTAQLLLYLRLDACFNSPPPQTSQVRKKNVLKDFVHMAAPFGVTHLVVFNKTDVGTNMRIARMPRGPTLTFRVNSFALMRDVVNSQSKPKSFGSQFDRSVGVVGITPPPPPPPPASFLLLLLLWCVSFAPTQQCRCLLWTMQPPSLFDCTIIPSLYSTRLPFDMIGLKCVILCRDSCSLYVQTV